MTERELITAVMLSYSWKGHIKKGSHEEDMKARITVTITTENKDVIEDILHTKHMIETGRLQREMEDDGDCKIEATFEFLERNYDTQGRD